MQQPKSCLVRQCSSRCHVAQLGSNTKPSIEIAVSQTTVREYKRVTHFSGESYKESYHLPLPGIPVQSGWFSAALSLSSAGLEVYDCKRQRLIPCRDYSSVVCRKFLRCIASNVSVTNKMLSRPFSTCFVILGSFKLMASHLNAYSTRACCFAWSDKMLAASRSSCKVLHC